MLFIQILEKNVGDRYYKRINIGFTRYQCSLVESRNIRGAYWKAIDGIERIENAKMSKRI